MARKKEFDPQKATHQAMHVFWLQGYDATSIDDLCNAMNIKRGSLYNAFPDKRSLYMQALQHYLHSNYPQDLSSLEDESPMQVLHMMFQSTVDDAVNDTQQRGCLMINTITELATTDPEIARFCVANNDQVQHMFTELLSAAQAQGEIAAHHDVKAKAQFLVNAFYGIRVTSMLTRDRDVLENIMNETLAALQ